ncbi:MAG TPA: carbohydrate kinase family protein [Aggregatilineales bacterium]|nr:carbohydrate kinase family protein [Aggregatilineales bacterium]
MDIVVTGSIAYDYLMRFPGRFREHILAENMEHVSLSFLVDELTRHWGGIAANIAYNLALLGQRPRLMGTVGKDFGDYRVWLEAAGVDTTPVTVIDTVFTASFFANTDLENNQIASFYSGAMAHARHYSLSDSVPGTPDYVVISPNDPDAMIRLADECHQRGIPFMYDPSQQVPRLEGEPLRHSIERCHTLIVNEYEWAMLSKKTGMSRADVLKCAQVLIVTLGKKGAEIHTASQSYLTPTFPVPDDRILDPTGVGDAFRAGILCGMAHKWPWEVSGKAAALCAAYVLENVGTQNHRYAPQEFVTRFRSVYDDAGVLDSLLHGA